MAGLSQILEIARRSLMSQRAALDTTSHNIANANTPGYSRQRAELIATDPLRESYGYIGTGVTVDRISRMRDAFLDQQIRSTNDTLSDASIRHQLLSQVESAFNEPSDAGLNQMMSKFFAAFQELSTHPEESSSRNSVLQNGMLLTQTFHRLDSNLNQLRSDLLNDVSSKITKINQLTQEISDLDIKITNANSIGANANDMQDQMDQKIEELSKLIDIKVSHDSKNSVMVSVGGTVIASRGGSVELKSSVVGNSIKIVAANTGNDVNVSSGEMGGILSIYNVEIPDYESKLDQLAAALISRVNSLHSAGYGLGTPPSTGINFFTGTTAADIDVNNSIKTNINNIAASSDGTPGDNKIAISLAGVINDKIMNGNTVSIAQYYTGFVSELGSVINSADNTVRSQELINSQLENQRSAVSGVSVDEEMTNMIKFQRAFDAAARVVNTVDEMYQSIIDMK